MFLRLVSHAFGVGIKCHQTPLNTRYHNAQGSDHHLTSLNTKHCYIPSQPSDLRAGPNLTWRSCSSHTKTVSSLQSSPGASSLVSYTPYSLLRRLKVASISQLGPKPAQARWWDKHGNIFAPIFCAIPGKITTSNASDSVVLSRQLRVTFRQREVASTD